MAWYVTTVGLGGPGVLHGQRRPTSIADSFEADDAENDAAALSRVKQQINEAKESEREVIFVHIQKTIFAGDLNAFLGATT